MAGDPRQAAPRTDLGPRIRRLLADNQRLIAFPVLAEALGLLAYLPLLLSLGGVETFSDYARAEANGAGTTRVLEDGTAVGAASLALFAGAVLLSALASAWAMAAFLRSFDRPAVVTRPDRPLLLRLFVLYLGVTTVGLVAVAVAPPLAPLVLVAALVPTLYADYAIAFDGCTLAGGMRSSMRFWRRFPGRSALAAVVLLIALQATYAMFGGVMEDAETVFPPVLLAMVLALGLVLYATNCVLIGLYADREPDPSPAI